MINSVCGIGSTGRICGDFAEEMTAAGHVVKIAYGRGVVPEKYQKYAVPISHKFAVYINVLSCRLFDNDGFCAKLATEKLIEKIVDYDPDEIHLHNLHGYYINIEILFDYLKRCNKRIFWTLHDCWAFTGHCPHFTVAKCEQWKILCTHCSQTRNYPASYFMDNCKSNFLRKRAAFSGVPNMVLITPSHWLANLVKQSFLKEYKIEVRYNKIDTTVFKPTPSDFREKYGLSDRKIILGVSSTWDERKGLNDFLKLLTLLGDSYTIVLVGLNEKQIKKMPEKIIKLPRTNSTMELAKIYTAADLFVNPSKEETFGLTTVEALSCGTKAIVYKDTACEEVVNNLGKGKGIAVAQDIQLLKAAIEEAAMGKREAKHENIIHYEHPVTLSY